ncbi:MoaD/ThiS family protein [Haliea sp. E17]|uniref:MoaD/ThiS family protein n=1 Tax=Haliea sp. E17 TaxID=3401576 RepID=UPI003AAF6EFF
MLQVLFFGRLREALDCERLEIAADLAGPDLDSLQSYLCATYGDTWHAELGAPNVIRALNQQMVQGNSAISDGDEIAFFPPVTGG